MSTNADQRAFETYIVEKGVVALLEDMGAELLRAKPDDPYDALVAYLRERPAPAPAAAPDAAANDDKPAGQ